MITENQLKAALVAALPEKLKITTTFNGTAWNDTLKPVTEHEWLAIVRMIEVSLERTPMEEYITFLAGYAPNWYHLNIPKTFEVATASWQVRAQALIDINAIKIP